MTTLYSHVRPGAEGAGKLERGVGRQRNRSEDNMLKLCGQHTFYPRLCIQHILFGMEVVDYVADFVVEMVMAVLVVDRYDCVCSLTFSVHQRSCYS